MKKIIIALIFANTFIAANAQKQKECFEIIKMLLPDSAAAGQIFSWNTSPEINTAIKWDAASPKVSGKEMVKNGKVSILLNGKPMVCEDNIAGSKHSCKWEVFLSGSKPGYTSFSLSVEDFPAEEAGTEIAYLFPKNKTAFTFMKSCMDGALSWSRLYKVTIPRKKTGWLIVEYQSLAATAAQYKNTGFANTISFTFYFDKARAESNCL